MLVVKVFSIVHFSSQKQNSCVQLSAFDPAGRHRVALAVLGSARWNLARRGGADPLNRAATPTNTVTASDLVSL